MKHTESINEIAMALSKAQGAFSAAERGHTAKVNSKKGEGSSYSYNYADLAAYLDVCREPMAEQGLAIVQSPTVNGDAVTVTTLLTHSSGQWIESDPLTLIADHDPEKHPTPQAIGSACTYARRYALSAMLAMAADDDDGAVGSGVQAETTKREPLPACPKCGTNKSVIVGKPEYGGGFVCYKAKGGCGEKWQPAPPQNAQGDVSGYTTLAPGIHASNQPTTSGNIMGESPQKISEDDAKYIANASESLRAASTEMELRSLWETVKEKAGPPIRAALIKVFQTRLKELSQAA